MKSFSFTKRELHFSPDRFRMLVRWILVISSLGLFFFASCKDDRPEVETDRIKKLLTADTWKVQTVTIDDADNTAMYTGLTLKFDATRFISVNGGVVWPASGVWTFADATGKLILRGDDLAIAIEEITDAKLVLKLTWESTTLGSGRVSSIAGEHLFVFER